MIDRDIGRTSVLCLIGAILSLGAVSGQTKRVERVKIISMNWNASTLVPQSPAMIVNKSHIVRIVTTNRRLIKRLSLFVDSLHTSIPAGSMDARLVCLLYRVGGHVDTLSFGGPGDMQYNDALFALDVDILYRIASFLSPYQRSEIKDNINIEANQDYIRKQRTGK
jgi:hypothetical protein